MSFERILKTAILVLAVGMSVYHLAVAYLGPPEAFFFRGAHLLFAIVLTFLINPTFRRRGAKKPGIVDYLLVILSVVTIGYLWLNIP